MRLRLRPFRNWTIFVEKGRNFKLSLKRGKMFLHLHLGDKVIPSRPDKCFKNLKLESKFRHPILWKEIQTQLDRVRHALGKYLIVLSRQTFMDSFC